MAELTTPGELVAYAQGIQHCALAVGRMRATALPGSTYDLDAGSGGTTPSGTALGGYTLTYDERLLVLDGNEVVALPSGVTTYTLPFIEADATETSVALDDGALPFYDANGNTLTLAVI